MGFGGKRRDPETAQLSGFKSLNPSLSTKRSKKPLILSGFSRRYSAAPARCDKKGGNEVLSDSRVVSGHLGVQPEWATVPWTTASSSPALIGSRLTNAGESLEDEFQMTPRRHDRKPSTNTEKSVQPAS